MSLDAPKSDTELLDELARREKAGPSRIVRLGPDSPLRRQEPAPRSGPKNELNSRRGRPGSSLIEHDIQVELIRRVNEETLQLQHPELALLYAIPSGGKRSKATAGKMKAEGVKPGVPDLHLPVPRGRYHSLYIELKRPGGSLTPEQPHWLAALGRHGHKCAIHHTADGALAELLDYLALPPESR